MTRLKIFRAVAGHGSFTRAADALGYAQPSVSHQIAQLERELGAQLFERRPRRVTLTPAGEVFLGHAESILIQLADAQREVGDMVQTGTWRLRVAAFPTAAATLMPAAAGVFRAQLPDVELSLTEADPPDALPALLAGGQDLALVYDYPALGAVPPPAAELEPLFGDHMAAAVPESHPLAGCDRVQLAELSDERWIAPHPCMCRDAVVFACRSAGFAPEIVSETNDYMAMQGLVAAGLGVALIPRLAAAIARRPGVRLLPLAGPAIERVTFVATRLGGYRSPTVEAFRAALSAALPAVEDHGLPLESYDLEHAVAAPGSRARSRPAPAPPPPPASHPPRAPSAGGGWPPG